MNALTVIFLAIIGLTNGQFASFCKKTSGEYEVVNPYSCSSFIKCDGHKGKQVSCLDGKVFDAKLLICRPSSVALCTIYDIPNYVQDLCKALPKGELVPGIECHKYYKCNDKNTTALVCPEGQHFSRAYSTCMSPLAAGCKALNAMCSDEYENFSFPSTSCDQYFVCNPKLKPELKTCQEGLHFSPNAQKCIAANESGCGIVQPSDTCDNVSAPVCDASNSGSFFPHPKPDYFYMCFNSEPLEMQCETGLTYDTLLKYCVKEGAQRVC